MLKNLNYHNVPSKNILFVSDSAGNNRVFKMASTLVKNNFKVNILEWDRNSEFKQNEIINALNVYRMKLKAPYGLKLVFFMPIWWIFLTFFVVTHNFNIIQVENLDNLIPLWFLSRIKKIKIVYDIADFYSDAFIPPKLKFIRYVIANMERLFISFVDGIFIVDISRLNQLGLNKNYVTIINNTPPDIYLNYKRNNTNYPRIDSNFIIFYGGILSKDRGLYTIIKAVHNLSNVVLLVAGYGEMEKEFTKIVKEISNVKFLGKIPYEKILYFSLMSDCIIALYDPHIPNNIVASPNKLFEAMMCEKPIIVNNGTNLSKIVEEKKCGLIINYYDVIGLKKAINIIKEQPELALSMGKNGRAAYLQEYSWDIMEKRLLKTYNS